MELRVSELASILASRVNIQSDPIACIEDTGQVHRYSDLLAISRRTRDSLASMNIRGGRLACLLPHHITTALAILNLSELVSILPLNPALILREQVEICSESRIEAIICTPETQASAAAIARRADSGLLQLSLETGALHWVPPSRTIGVGHWPAGLVLFTSGSTGTPKRVPLSSANLFHSARSIARTLQLGPSDRAGHLLPMFHIGALVDLVLAPLVSGGSIALATNAVAETVRDLVLARGATWLQFVPTMLVHVMESLSPDASAEIGRKLRFIRSVSSDLSPARQEKAEKLFGVPVVGMYGMTEAAGQIASNPLPPHVRKPGTVGRPDGVEVAILDVTGSFLLPGAQGEICIRGHSVMSGYEETDRRDHFHQEWLRTGDLGRFDEDGYLTLTGRRKEMINRGGEKISPVEIERAALSIAAVKEAVAYGMPHPTLGEMVGLSVVLQDGASLSEQDLMAALTAGLAEFKRPRKITIVTELPRLGSGKLDRRRVRAAMDRLPPLEFPTSELGRTVARGWQDVLRCDTPLPGDDFFELGGDSLSGLQLILELERATGRKLSGNVLFESPRFADFVARLAAAPMDEGKESRVWAHIRRSSAAWPGAAHRPGALMLGLRTAGAKAPLFFGVQATGEAEGMREVVAPDRPVYIMRTLYGLVPRSLAEKRELAAIYAEEIAAIQPEGAVHLGGFCEGAETAAMIAEFLLAQGRQIAILASIDHWFASSSCYPVLHIWTACPRYSPGAMFYAPERALPLMHPAGFRVIRIPGDHTLAMNRECLKEAGALLERLMAGEERIEAIACADRLSGIARTAMYRANLKAKLPLLMKENDERMTEVHVSNTSDADWPDTEAGGPVLRARLIPRGGGRLPVAGFAPLPAALKPGQAMSVPLPIRPAAAGLMRLEIAVTDDGLADFGPRLVRNVWVRRKRR